MPGRDFTSEERIALLRLLDEAGVREVIGKYFFALDRREFEILEHCFTEDAKGEYDGGKALYDGRPAILDAMRPIEKFKSTSHVTSSMAITIDSQGAKADTYALAFLTLNDRPLVLVRGLQYLDRLVRSPQGWRICHRIHIPLWQYEIKSVPPASLLAK